MRKPNSLQLLIHPSSVFGNWFRSPLFISALLAKAQTLFGTVVLINDDRRFRSRNFHGQQLSLCLLTTLNATFLARSWMSSVFSFRVGRSWFIMLVVYKMLFNINYEEIHFGRLSFGLSKTRPFHPRPPLYLVLLNQRIGLRDSLDIVIVKTSWSTHDNKIYMTYKQYILEIVSNICVVYHTFLFEIQYGIKIGYSYTV